MTDFEQEEINDYAEVWFLGLGSQKIEGSQGSAQNNGYDDEHGSYVRVSSLTVRGVCWWSPRFCFIKKLFGFNDIKEIYKRRLGLLGKK